MDLREYSNDFPPHLPPLDAWKISPTTIRNFIAPTDDRGFVLPEETIDMVKSFFEDDYEWPVDSRFQQTQPDIHHFHWYRNLYDPSRFGGKTAARDFRNLPTVLGVLPRQFHNTAHMLAPPKLPEYEDMAKHVRAYKIAKSLFESALYATETMQQREALVASDDQTANSMLQDRYSSQFGHFKQRLEEMIEVDGAEILRLDIGDITDCEPAEMARILGAIAFARPISYLSKFDTYAIAA